MCTIPGVQRRTAEVIIAETDGDMSMLAVESALQRLAQRRQLPERKVSEHFGVGGADGERFEHRAA